MEKNSPFKVDPGTATVLAPAALSAAGSIIGGITGSAVPGVGTLAGLLIGGAAGLTVGGVTYFLGKEFLGAKIAEFLLD